MVTLSPLLRAMLCGATFVMIAANATAAVDAPVARLIVKLRDTGTMTAQAETAGRLARLSSEAASAGTTLAPLRAMAQGAHVMKLGERLPRAAAEALAARLAQSPDVEYVQPDYRRRALRTPDDTSFSRQWYLASTPAGVHAVDAWDLTTGSAGVVIAVVDGGYLPHADLAGRVLPGYDFVSDPKVANDGNGRDADATDPGDWIDAYDYQDPDFDGCAIEESSWHGTAVAGIIAANSNNGLWVAGIDWTAKILPVRVLGKCGGYDSDIIDGVAWAAGLAVPGVPANPHPAQIINISLGGDGECMPLYHSVFGGALAHGVTRAIIAAAGNEAADVSTDAPANCSETIAVAATTNEGALAGYSNFGSGVALSAPGGTKFIRVDGIAVLSNSGTTGPAGDAWAWGSGTSFAAPIVSGIASLVLGVAPSLTATQLRALLTSTAASFPAASDCTTALCGAGIVNAQAAVLAAQGGGSAVPNYQGLWWAAPAGSEDGWGINFAHQGEVIFGTWFTYDTTGKGWWMTLIVDDNAMHGTYTGKLFATTGPPFNAVPFTMPPGSAPAVGTATLTFTDASNGSFHYEVDRPGGKVIQTKTITRQALGAAPFAICSYGTEPNLAAATHFQDIWWAGTSGSPGTEQGWGINFAQQGDIVFASWFTYDLDGTPLWLVATTTKIAPATYRGALYRPSGPRFDAYDKSQWHANPSVGTMTLTFTNGNNATFDYTVQLPGMTSPVHQVKTITRELFSPLGTTCR